jgi:carboxylate-amine ligase
MSTLEFAISQPLTVGVELELQCLNSRDYDLSTSAQEILELVKEMPCGGVVKPEITQSMIEINSDIHHRHDTLLANLQGMRDVLVDKASLLNERISGGGSHAFQMWSERRVFEHERYAQLWERYGYLAKQFTVFGQHVHIGCANGDDAVRLLHRMSYYIPAFIALSASSPYYQSQDTLFSSSRLTSISAFPLSGTMPFLRSWEEFCGYYHEMESLGIVASMKDFYWDIRPKPEYGTIELRICDTPLTVETAAALAAFAQTLAHWMNSEPAKFADPRIYLPYRYNRFQAARYGLRGQFIDAVARSQHELGEMISVTIDRLWDHARELGTTEPLLMLQRSARTRRNDADWMRAIYAESRSFSTLARMQADIWARSSTAQAALARG